MKSVYQTRSYPIFYNEDYADNKQEYLSQFEKVYNCFDSTEGNKNGDSSQTILRSSNGIERMRAKLIFESNFENGNLKEAYKISNTKYILLMNEDTNTKGFY
jgi:hypothetical protein